LYYEPTKGDKIIELTGKGITYFGLGNWYIPDSREVERIIYHRINSTIENSNNTELAWCYTNAATGTFNVSKRVFKEDAFN
jgi:hypothetical protein